MTPTFALSLSVDGIGLLHRTTDGWSLVGDANPEVDDLAAAMAGLKKKAQELGTGDLNAKLVLPNEQIRYLTIETARTSLDDIHAAITAATPLALDEMVIDFDRSGGRTYIAAVAKQTLDEAETFAIDHGFAPVSFVAVAEDYTFTSEVFFGPTRYARETLNIGADLARDDVLPVATVLNDAEDAPDAPPKTPDAPTPEPTENIFNDADSDGADDETIDVSVPVFASRNREALDPSAMMQMTAADRPKAETNLQSFVEKLATTEPNAPAVPAPMPADLDSDPVNVVAPSTRPKSRTKSRLLTPSEDHSGLLTPTGKEPRAAAVPVPKTQADLAFAKGLAQSGTSNKPRYLGLIMTAALLFIMFIVAMWASTRLENGIAGLLLGDPGLQEDASLDVPQIDPIPAPVIAPAEAEVATASAPVVTAPVIAQEDTPPTPIVTAIPGRVLSPADAARIYAATGVWQRAPRLPDRSGDGNLDGIHSFATVAGVKNIARPGTPDIDDSIPDLRMVAPTNPAPINRPLPRDADGFVLASANGTILPTGVWIYGRAPTSKPPLRPTDEPVGLDDTSIPEVQDDFPTQIEYVAFSGDPDWPAGEAYASTALSQPVALDQPNTVAPRGLAAAQALLSPPAIVPVPAPTPDPVPAPQVAAPVIDPIAPNPDLVTPAEDAATIAAVPDAVIPETGTPATSNAPEGEALVQTDDTLIVPDGFVEVIFGRPAIVPPLRPGTPEVAPEAEIADLATEAVPLASIETAPQANALLQTEDDATIAPEGRVQVISGRPAIVPPLRPGTPEVAPEPETADLATEDSAPDAQTATALSTNDAPALFQDAALAGIRPAPRPDSLVVTLQTFEAIPALAGPRPLVRPASLVVPAPKEPEEVTADPADIAAIMASISAAAPPSQIVSPTRSAITASPRPDTRPRNFARVVASAQSLQSRQQSRESAASTAAAVVPAAPTVAAPTAPATGGRTTTAVATAATAEDAIRLRDMNLIGVYGKAGARRALIRLSNGRFVKVEVGSRLDGGRVTAIGDSALNFVKRGQTYALQLPAG